MRFRLVCETPKDLIFMCSPIPKKLEGAKAFSGILSVEGKEIEVEAEIIHI